MLLSAAVHHLSVPCFMLRHHRSSREGWTTARQMVARFLNGVAPEEARHDLRKAVRGGTERTGLPEGQSWLV